MKQSRPALAPAPAFPPPGATSTRDALVFVYLGYFARYLQLMILIPFFGRVLGAAEYGKVLAAMSLFTVVWMVVQYGFAAAGVRTVAAARTREDVAIEFGSQLKARLVMSLAGLAIGAGGILVSPLMRAEPAYGLAATALGIASAFNLGWYFQAVQRFRTSILLEVAGFVINVALVLVLVRGPGDGVYVLASLLASSIVVLVASYGIAARELGMQAMRSGRAMPLIRQTGTLFTATGMPVLMTGASSYLLTLYAGAEEVGFFGAAERIASLGLSLMVPAGQVLVAVVSRRLSDPQAAAHAYGLMRRALFVMGAFGLTACAGVLLFAPFFVPLALGKAFGSAIPIMQILGLMFPFAAFSQAVRMCVLVPMGHDELMMSSAVLGALATVVGVLALAGPFGGLGVAAARVGGEVVTALVLSVALTRRHVFGRIFGT